MVCFYPQSQQMYGRFIMAISGVHLRPNTNLLLFSSAQLYAGAKRSRISGIGLIKKGGPVTLRLLGSFRKEVWWMTTWEYLILLTMFLKMSTPPQWDRFFVCFSFLIFVSFLLFCFPLVGEVSRMKGGYEGTERWGGLECIMQNSIRINKKLENDYNSFVV